MMHVSFLIVGQAEKEKLESLIPGLTMLMGTGYREVMKERVSDITLFFTISGLTTVLIRASSGKTCVEVSTDTIVNPEEIAQACLELLGGELKSFVNYRIS